MKSNAGTIWIIGLLAVAFNAITARAATSVSLAQLISTNGSLTVGGKTFSDFGFQGNTERVNPTNILVETSMSPGGFLGFRFGGNNMANGTNLSYALFYSVRLTNGLPLLSGIGQTFLPAATGNGGFILVGETVWSQGFFLGPVVAQSSIGFDDLVDPLGELIQGDHLLIDPPLSKVWVTTEIHLEPNDLNSSVGVLNLDQLFCDRILSLTCAMNQTVECGTAWNFNSPSATNFCCLSPIAITVVSTVTNALCGNTFTATRTWQATDNCTNSATCSQTVTIIDTTPPVLTCASNRLVECGAAWSFDTPGAIDLCDDTNVVITIVSTVTNALCGNTFTTTRTWQATDGCGNSALCSQTVTIIDTTAPVITCASNRLVECGIAWNFDAPGATDICDDTNLTITIVSTVTNALCGNTFAATRTWQAMDGCTNSATCSQTVTIIDTTAPVITCVSSRSVECGVAWNLDAPTATDICDDTNVTITIVSTVTNALCGNTFTATRTWRATDNCTNSATCSQTVTIIDTTAPVITCVSSRSVECGVAWNFDAPTATDICDDTNVTITIVSTVTNALCGNTFTATRTWRATDNCSNSATCSQTVTIIDTTAPIIVCASNRLVECGVAWNFDAPAATDICDDTNVTITIVSTATNALCGNTFTATRTWRATDNCTNSATCSQTVTIIDTTAPIIVCASNRLVECGVAWNFDAPGATDICDDTNVTITIVSTVTNQLVGQTYAALRTWRATDACSNSSICSQTVTIVDSTPPQISCSTNITVECPCPLGRQIIFGTAAVDICDTNVVVICVPSSGAIFTPGTTLVRCAGIDDSGNTNSCSFTVTIRDTTDCAPLITCVSNIIATEFPHDRGTARVTFAAPITRNFCSNTLVVACVPPSGASFPVGESTVTCTVRDNILNTNACTFVIRVIPYRLPVTSIADAGPGTLRQALLDANDAPGENLIVFDLAGRAPHLLQLLTALPVVTSPVILDGWSQPGFGGTPVIELEGSGTGGADGLIINAGHSTVRGLALRGFATAIRLQTNGGNIIHGNFLGPDATGTNRSGNSADGLYISSMANFIGGPGTHEGNVIAFNQRNGVSLDAAAGAGSAIRANAVFANLALGIDLGADGPTANDAGDADIGPNNRQNFPMLSDARSEEGITTIDGTLDSEGGKTYRLDFFLNDSVDPAGFGEGARYIGSTTVATSSTGTSEFSASFPLRATYVQFITATATDPGNNTSEFSPPVQVRTPPVLEVEPVNTSAAPGAPATLCAQASGTPPLFYQWRLNGENIPGATNSCHTIPSADAGDGGNYSVVVVNVLGAVRTGQAALRLPFATLRAGDNFADRVPLSSTGGVVSGANRLATQEPGEPDHAGKRGGKSVWYTWEAPSTGVATIGTRGSTFDTLLAVYKGRVVTNLVGVASDEDRGGFFTSGLRFNAIKDRNYHFAIDGYGGEEGDFIFGWSHQKTDHLLPVIVTQPISRTVAPGARVTFTVVAVRDEEDEDDDDDDDHPGFRYQWLYNGGPIVGATRPTLTLTNVQAESVGTYSVQVSTYYWAVESEEASLQINETGSLVQPVQALDKFLDAANSPAPLRLGTPGGGNGAGFAPAALVRGYTGTQVFNTAGATTSGGDEIICGVLGGASEWISFVAEENGVLALNTDGSTYNTVMAVFRRSPTNAALLQLLGCDNNSGLDGRDSALSVPVEGGRTNFIVVDGVNGAVGTLRLNFSLVTAGRVVSLGFTRPEGYQLQFNGRPVGRFALQTSTNLANWTTILTTTNASSGLFNFNDPGSTSAPVRFYRAQSLP